MTSQEEAILAQVDAQLNAMDAPTSAEVFYGLEEFSPRHQVAAAARVAKAGGGSQAVVVSSKTLSAADLLALDTTAFELLPAPSGRNYYFPTAFVFHYRFGTTPYTGDLNMAIGYGSTVSDITYPAAGILYGGLSSFPNPHGENVDESLLANTSDAYAYVTLGGGATPDYNGWLATEIEGLAFIAANFPTVPLADGDGTLTIRTFYSLIDGAP